MHWAATALGLAMVITSFGAVLDGLPRQVIANWRSKTAPDVLHRFLVWGFFAYALRAAYTSSVGDYLTAMAALPGALMVGAQLIQRRIYPPARQDDDGHAAIARSTSARLRWWLYRTDTRGSDEPASGRHPQRKRARDAPGPDSPDRR